MRLLLVEDDERIRHFLRKGLVEESWAVDFATSGEEALYYASVNAYDVIILDIMIPEPDGLEVCRRLRADGCPAPVLMLTARDGVGDKVEGFNAGADDYLTKPFAFAELTARLRALVRRKFEQRPAVLSVADLRIDTRSRSVWRGERAVLLTAKEYGLLEYLAVNAGKVVTRGEIYEHVWDETLDPMSNVIEVMINRIRRKIDSSEPVKLLHTRRGAGYVLARESKIPGGPEPAAR
ncbi:MAG: response regulator transcription factor [Thermoanaerobaculia bacterium]